MASEGGRWSEAPGVTTLGSGSQNSVASGGSLMSFCCEKAGITAPPIRAAKIENDFKFIVRSGFSFFGNLNLNLLCENLITNRGKDAVWSTGHGVLRLPITLGVLPVMSP